MTLKTRKKGSWLGFCFERRKKQISLTFNIVIQIKSKCVGVNEAVTWLEPFVWSQSSQVMYFQVL